MMNNYNTKKLGSVNPCNIATLYDKHNKQLGTTLDTPNAIAYAMATNQNVEYAKTFYKYFNDEPNIYTREQLKDRFKWITKEKDIHNKFLKWNK